MPFFKEKERKRWLKLVSFLQVFTCYHSESLNLKAPLAVVRHGFEKTFILDEVGEEDEEPWDFVGSGDSGQFLVTSWNGA